MVLPAPGDGHEGQIMKAFEGGKVRFVSYNKKLVAFPLGPPRRMLVGGAAVMTPTPLCEFDENRYATEDPATAKALIEDKMNFDQTLGYSVDASCLPIAFRDFWPHMRTETRKNVMLAFIEGKTQEQAFDLIPKNETRGRTKEESETDVYQLDCPEKPQGCKFVAKGEFAQQTLAGHMLIKHGVALQATG